MDGSRGLVDLDVGACCFLRSRWRLPEAAFGCAWLTALAAVATAELVSAWTGRDARIKWPNDVRVEGRKIAGILVERVVVPPRPDATTRRGETLARRGRGHRDRPERQPRSRCLSRRTGRECHLDAD